MRLRLIVSLLATVAFAGAASAASLSGMGANLYGNYFHFGKPNLSKPMVRSMTVGSVRIDLQHTKLSQIKAAFGGTIMSQGSEESLARWLCYHDEGKAGATDTWFITNTLGGGEFVMIVAVQASTAGRVPADCGAAPAKFSPPNMGIPGVGASLADLKGAFGAASGSTITYRADEPGADALGTANNAQYIAYMLSGGRVVGYGAGETSVPVANKS
ncbi:MAG: hypothetical protein ABI697_07270 [Devosia sp.]